MKKKLVSNLGSVGGSQVSCATTRLVCGLIEILMIVALTVKYITHKFIMDYDPYIDGKYSKLDMVAKEPVIVRVWDTYTHPGVSYFNIT